MAVAGTTNASDDSAGALSLLLRCRKVLSTPLPAMGELSLLTSQSEADEKRIIHHLSYQYESRRLANIEYGRVIVVYGTLP